MTFDAQQIKLTSHYLLLRMVHESVTVSKRISGLVVEYVVAIDVTRVRFPADAFVRVFSPILVILLCGIKFRCRDSNPGRSGESRVS